MANYNFQGAPKGNNFAAGHKKSYAKIKNRFRKLLNESISDEDFKKVVARLIEICMDGNKRESSSAIRILFEYVCGKPSQEVDVNASLSAQEQFAQIQKAIIENIADDKKEQ